MGFRVLGWRLRVENLRIISVPVQQGWAGRRESGVEVGGGMLLRVYGSGCTYVPAWQDWRVEGPRFRVWGEKDRV